jgi:cytochrome b561
MRELFYEAHEVIGLIILLVIILHIIGALKHKFIDKDDTLKRML